MKESFYIYISLLVIVTYALWIFTAYSNTKKKRASAGKLLLSMQSSKAIFYTSIIYFSLLFVFGLAAFAIGKVPIVIMMIPVFIDTLLKNTISKQIREFGIVSVEGFFLWKEICSYEWYYSSNTLLFKVVQSGKAIQLQWNVGNIDRGSVEAILDNYTQKADKKP